MTKEAKILIAIAGVVVIGGVLLAIFANPQPQDAGTPVDSQNMIRSHSPMTGKADAKVKIVEFGDFQCPACAAAAPNLEKLIDEYKGNDQVTFVWRHFPLKSIHQNAEISSEAAQAAADQGKFWEMYKVLYQQQTQWAESPDPLDLLVSYAQQLGLDADKFRTAVSQKQYSDIINTDIKDGEGIGVNSTPSIFINGEKAPDYQYDTLKKKIEEELKK